MLQVVGDMEKGLNTMEDLEVFSFGNLCVRSGVDTQLFTLEQFEEVWSFFPSFGGHAGV